MTTSGHLLAARVARCIWRPVRIHGQEASLSPFHGTGRLAGEDHQRPLAGLPGGPLHLGAAAAVAAAAAATAAAAAAAAVAVAAAAAEAAVATAAAVANIKPSCLFQK